MPYSIEIQSHNSATSTGYETALEWGELKLSLVEMVKDAIGPDAIGFNENAVSSPMAVSDEGTYFFRKPNTAGEESDGCTVYISEYEDQPEGAPYMDCVKWCD